MLGTRRWPTLLLTVRAKSRLSSRRTLEARDSVYTFSRRFGASSDKQRSTCMSDRCLGHDQFHTYYMKVSPSTPVTPWSFVAHDSACGTSQADRTVYRCDVTGGCV